MSPSRGSTLAMTGAAFIIGTPYVLGLFGHENIPSAAGSPGSSSAGKAYKEMVQEWGHKCPQLKPSLLAAQINQESGWNPKAKSPAKAQGIAQFIPGTWDTHAIDANKDGKRDVWDPEDAIPSAAVYNCTLAKDVKDVPGDPVDNMLAAYNAGPNRVISAGGTPNIRETQDYVVLIKSGADKYKSWD